MTLAFHNLAQDTDQFTTRHSHLAGPTFAPLVVIGNARGHLTAQIKVLDRDRTGGNLVAADPKLLPLGSIVSIPGYAGDAVVPVLDVGGAIKGNKLDVLYATHARARQWGVQELEVIVWEYADGQPSGFKRLRRNPK